MEKSIVYFDHPGKDNTAVVLDVVARRLSEGDVRHVCVASTSGATALAAREAVADPSVDVIGVPFQKPYWKDYREPDPELARRAIEKGARFIPDEPVAPFFGDLPRHSPHTLYLFGQGVKVALEVCLMAAEARMFEPGTVVIGVGGTRQGADTALVVRAYPAERVEEVWVSEILAKPR